MTTIIEKERPSSVLVERGDSGAGWAVAVVILVAVVAVGAFVWMRYYRAPAATQTPGTTVQVNLPTGGSNNAPAATPTP